MLIFIGIRDYNFYWNFLLDVINHVLLSLYGVYLIKIKDIYFKRNKQISSASIIVVVAIVMLIINIVLKTSFQKDHLILNLKVSLINNHIEQLV